MRYAVSPGYKSILRHWWKSALGSVSMFVVCICTGLFLLVALADILQIAEKRAVFSYLGLSYYGMVEYHRYYQPFTSVFLHANIAHLLFNMLTVWLLGPSVEEKLGKKGYIGFSIISALCAMIAVLIANWRTGTITVGYSGVIYGILVAQAMFFPENRIAIFAFFPVKMKHAVILFAAIELYLTISPEGGVVSHVSHLFGAVGAFVYLLIQKTFATRTLSKIQRKKPSKAVAALRKIRIERDIPKKL